MQLNIFPADVLPRIIKKIFEGRRQVMFIFPADVLLRFYTRFPVNLNKLFDSLKKCKKNKLQIILNP